MLGLTQIAPLAMPEKLTVYYDFFDAIEVLGYTLILVFIFILSSLIVAIFFKFEKNNMIAIIATNFLVIFPFYSLILCISSRGNTINKSIGSIQWLHLFIIPLIEGAIYNKVLKLSKKSGYKFAFISWLLGLIILISLPMIIVTYI